MPSLYVWWVGEGGPDLRALGDVERSLGSVFDLPVHVRPRHDAPAGTYDVQRRQHSSTAMLRWLLARRPADATKLLAITDVDLFIPVLTFVYGEAQLNGGVAVVSTARLTQGAPAGSPLFVARLVKECVHELGHTFGLVHCSRPQCVMARSMNLAGVDAKTPALCPDCRLHYLERLSSAAGDTDVQGPHPHPHRR